MLTGANLAAHDAGAVSTFANYLSDFAYSRVDGAYAGEVSDVRLVMGSGSYAHAGSVYRNNTSIGRR